MSTPTTNYQLDKPAVGGDADVWGGFLNVNLDDLDTFLGKPRWVKNAPVVAATTPINLALANFFEFTVSQATSIVFSNVPATLPDATVPAIRVLLKITNGSAFVLTFPGSVIWPGGTAPTFTSSGVDIVGLVSYDVGTTWYASLEHIKTAAPARLFNNVDAGTGAVTTEVTLRTHTVGAGLLGTNGVLRIVGTFTVLDVAGNTKTVRMKFGGTTVVTIAGALPGHLSQFELFITNRNSASAQRVTGRYFDSSGVLQQFAIQTIAINTALAQDVVVTGQTANASDEVTVHTSLVEILPA